MKGIAKKIMGLLVAISLVVTTSSIGVGASFVNEQDLTVKELLQIGSVTHYYRVTEESVTQISEIECMAAVNELKPKLDKQKMMMVQRCLNPESYETMAIDESLTDDVTTHDGYMKYSVSVEPASGTNNYRVSADFEWLVEPDDTAIDVWGVGYDSNLVRLGSEEVTFSYTVDVTEYIGTQINSSTVSISLEDAEQVKYGIAGVAISFDLYSGFAYEGHVRIAENHRGEMSYVVHVSNPNVDMVAVRTEYLHQEAYLTISPSISYPWDGLSVGVGQENKFREMSPNPYLSFEV